MDIKDSYLHGTVGVVKSISVSADKLKYKLADIAGTVKEVTLPVATTSANGLMSSGDKIKLDNLSSTIGNYVTLNTDQDITGTKTFTKQLKFTVADGTAPFTVTSTTKVPNLNADLLDGFGESAFLKDRGVIKADTIETTLTNGVYHTSEFSPINGGYNYGTVLNFRSYPTLTLFYLSDGAQTKPRIWYRNKWNAQTIINTSWLEILTSNSYTNYTVGKDGTGATGTWGINITGNAATADKLKTKRKLWGLDFDGTADVKGSLVDVDFIRSNTTNGYFVGNRNNGLGVTDGGLLLFSYGNTPISLYTNHAERMIIKGDGKIGMGISNPSEKLEVNGNVKATSFIGNLNGNSDTATKLQTKRKLWGQEFDGSADVSGNMTGVGNVSMTGDLTILSGNTDKYITFDTEINEHTNSWRIGYIGSNSGNENYFILQSTKNTPNTWTSALTITNETLESIFVAPVTAPTFMGKLDGTYVNALTGYSKATSIAALANTDTLNTALGKLEYKADVAYDWYKSVTGTDNDDIINKWEEIVDFIDALKEGTDITDEFVTRKTNLTITGYKVFSSENESMSIKRTGSYSIEPCISYFDNSTKLGAMGLKKDVGPFWWDTKNVFSILHSGTSHIKNGIITINGNSITPLTSHLSLANYVTLNTNLTISGLKTFNNDVYIVNNKSIHFNDSDGKAKLVLGVTTSNQLLVGHNMATSGYDTAIRGRKIYLQTSSSFVNGLTINESGHVGILKTAPTCALDVTGEIRMLSDKSDGQGIIHKILVYKTSPYGLITRTYGNGNVSLLVLRESNDSETFNLILQPLGGKVGIGTATINTNALLQVNGNILATKFITSGGTSSQFVKGDGSLDSNTYLTSHLSLANYVTLNSAQTISGVKTFSTLLKFTVALGTSPFTVTSTTVVSNLNADYWDGKHWSDLIIGGRNYYKQYSGCAGLTKDPSIKGYTINSSNGINRIDNLGFDGYVGNWTVSFEIKASAACTVNVNLCDYTASSAYGDSSNTSVTTSYVKHTYVFLNVGKYHTSDSYNGFLDIENSSGYKIYIKNIKIEKGTKATDWSYAPEDLVHIGNTHIKDGVITINGTSITPLTQHQSLSNYLKKNGDTGTGLYVFKKDIDESKTNATVDGCPVDIQHRTQFKVMRASDTWSLTFGVKENLGWIDCVADGIGYGDIYLNPAGVSVIVGNYNGAWSIFSKNNRSEKLIVFGDQYVSGFSLTNGIKKFNSSNDYILLGGGGHEDKSTFAKRKNVNDFIHAGNEFTFASPKHEGEIYMNFRTASNLTDGNITAYRFCDGKGGTLASITLGSFNGSASNLKASTVVNSSQFNLSNASWTDTGYTFANLASGTYAVQVTSGSNLVASGIMSVYKNLSDTAGDEIPLHVYGTAGWRPYLRTYANKLLISSNDASATSRTVTIKIALIL